MPVGGAGVGTAIGVGVPVSELVFSSTEFELPTGFGTAGGVAAAVGGFAATARIIATKASEFESGDQTIVSGKWTAIVSEGSFLSSLPSGEYISKRYSAITSAIFRETARVCFLSGDGMVRS